jgi:hypothetical protein
MTEPTTKPSFGKLMARKMHFGPSGNGSPYISDGDTARVLCFANLSGAYNGTAGASQAHVDMQTIAHRVNVHDELVEVLAHIRRCVRLDPASGQGFVQIHEGSDTMAQIDAVLAKVNGSPA